MAKCILNFVSINSVLREVWTYAIDLTGGDASIRHRRHPMPLSLSGRPRFDTLANYLTVNNAFLFDMAFGEVL